MVQKVLVTGGAGYIGSILTSHLLAQGCEVTVIDDFRYGQNSLASVCHLKSFKLHMGDVRDKNLMKSLVKDKDVVIPLAALVGAPLCERDPVGAETINKQAVRDLFQMLSPEQIVLMPTSNSAYGTGDENNLCDEKSDLRPISLYARQKVEVEKWLLDRENSISFRLATVFGMSPRMRLDLLVNDFTWRALTDGTLVLFESHFKRNYIHVRDVAHVFSWALNNFDAMKGEIFNVGLSEANLSKKELCERIKEHLPNFTFVEAPVGKDPDQRNYIVSNEKIEATGWKPSYSLDVGIEELKKGLPSLKIPGRFKNC